MRSLKKTISEVSFREKHWRLRRESNSQPDPEHSRRQGKVTCVQKKDVAWLHIRKSCVDVIQAQSAPPKGAIVNQSILGNVASIRNIPVWWMVAQQMVEKGMVSAMHTGLYPSAAHSIVARSSLHLLMTNALLIGNNFLMECNPFIHNKSSINQALYVIVPFFHSFLVCRIAS